MQQVHQNDILWIVELIQRLEIQVQSLIANQVQPTAPQKDWYTPAKNAELVGKGAYTIRTYIRQGKLRAQKRGIGHGGKAELEISKEELQRFINHGVHRN